MKKTDPLIAEMINLLARAEARGAEKASARILERIGATANLSENDDTERASPGTSAELIARALKTARNGLTPKEIRAAAVTPAERSLSASSIYNALSKGMKEGQYVKTADRRWKLGT